MVVGDSFFSPGGPSRVVAAGSRPDHPEARGRSKSQERGGPGPHAKPDGQILVFWIIALLKRECVDLQNEGWEPLIQRRPLEIRNNQ